MALLIANSNLKALTASASLELTPGHAIEAAAQLSSLSSNGELRLPQRPSDFALAFSPLRFDERAYVARGPDGSMVATAAHGLVLVNVRDPVRPTVIGSVTAPIPRGISSTEDRLFVLLGEVSAAQPQARLISAPNTSLAAITEAVAARSPAITYQDASQAPLALWGPDSSYAAGADFIVVLQPSGIELRSADAVMDLLAVQLLPIPTPAVVEVVARPDLALSAPLLAAHQVWDILIVSERGGEAALVRYDRREDTGGGVRHDLAVVRPFTLLHAEGPLSLSQAYSHMPPERSCGASAPWFALALRRRNRLQVLTRALDGTLDLESESFFDDLHGADTLRGNQLEPAVDAAAPAAGIQRPVARTIGTEHGELRLHSGLGSLDRRFSGPAVCSQSTLSPLTVSAGDGIVVDDTPGRDDLLLDITSMTTDGDILLDDTSHSHDFEPSGSEPLVIIEDGPGGKKACRAPYLVDSRMQSIDENALQIPPGTLERTWALWVRAGSVNADLYSNNAHGMGISISPSQAFVSVGLADGPGLGAYVSRPTDGLWQFILAEYSRHGELRIEVNRVVEEDSTNPDPSRDEDFAFYAGGRPYIAYSASNYDLAMIRIWDRLLTEGEKDTLYAQGSE